MPSNIYCKFFKHVSNIDIIEKTLIRVKQSDNVNIIVRIVLSFISLTNYR